MHARCWVSVAAARPAADLLTKAPADKPSRNNTTWLCLCSCLGRGTAVAAALLLTALECMVAQAAAAAAAHLRV